ncbi:Dabb family protein [Thalassospira sp. MA62]|nr:Dabb family protein [Thalassospira sp. MA62]
MIRHVVMIQIDGTADPAQVRDVFNGLQQAALNVDGMMAYCAGANLVGSGLNQGFTHCITIDFDNAAARDFYLSELDRDGIGARLSQITVGGLGGILVMNIDISDISTRRDTGPRKLQARWD